MHPIERLRFVARASGADQEMIVRESAAALAGLGVDAAGLVTACRRIVERHVTSAPLWWLCARVLTAPEPTHAGWDAADEIAGDTTAIELAAALPDDAQVCLVGWPAVAGEAIARRGDARVLVVDSLGEGAGLARRLRRVDVEADEVAPSGLGAAVAWSQLVLLEATAIGPDGFIGVAGSRAAAAVARQAGVPVWVVGGVGRLLPRSMWDALVRRFEDQGDPWLLDDEVVPLDLVDRLCGPAGPEPVAEGLRRTDCPVTPELFRLVG
jgi:hypothetical protein